MDGPYCELLKFLWPHELLGSTIPTPLAYVTYYIVHLLVKNTCGGEIFTYLPHNFECMHDFYFSYTEILLLIFGLILSTGDISEDLITLEFRAKV